MRYIEVPCLMFSCPLHSLTTWARVLCSLYYYLQEHPMVTAAVRLRRTTVPSVRH